MAGLGLGAPTSSITKGPAALTTTIAVTLPKCTHGRVSARRGLTKVYGLLIAATVTGSDSQGKLTVIPTSL